MELLNALELGATLSGKGSLKGITAFLISFHTGWNYSPSSLKNVCFATGGICTHRIGDLRTTWVVSKELQLEGEIIRVSVIAFSRDQWD